MSRQNLSVYLNDHLAGSVAAVGLLERLRGQFDDPEANEAVADLQQAIERDQQMLRDLMARLDIEESSIRKAGASIARKLFDVKFRFSRGDSGELQILHALDVLALGVEGKKAMWEALAEASESDLRLQDLPYGSLVLRADDQLATLRILRIGASRRALSA